MEEFKQRQRATWAAGDYPPLAIGDVGERVVARAVVEPGMHVLDVEWVEGDADELPFDDDRFDRVFSTFGHMFAPRHRRAADELARVCRAGGAIGICCRTPEGTAGDVARASAAYMPPPDFAEPPMLWGTENRVREMFPHAGGFGAKRGDDGSLLMPQEYLLSVIRL